MKSAPDGSLNPLARLVALAQGIDFIFTGVWPIVSPGTFQAITGPKTDMWLVKTTGALITTVGTALVMAGVKRRVTPETSALGVGSAASLAGADIIYSTRGRIRKVYLLESVAELGIIGLWVASLLAPHRR